MGGLDDCSDTYSGDCKLLWIISILYIWHLFLGLLPIIFIVLDIWRAFKKRKHWIPPLSLVLSSFSLQLLALLNNSLRLPYEGYTLVGSLTGRASVCLFMGYLLPAVGSPLSPNIWNDMAALIVVTSIPLFQIAYDIFALFTDPNHLYSIRISDISSVIPNLAIGWNVTMFVSIIVVVVLLSCAALASVGIHQIACHKIPIVLSVQKFNHQFSWEKVEEHVIKSVVLVRSSSHQYILSRSILTSPIALITAICIWIVIDVSFLGSLEFRVQMIFLYPFIILASGIIFWRCITATVYYPRKISWKWSSIKQYFKMEDFWLSYLQELEGKSLRVEGMDKSRFKKLMNKLWRGTVVHSSLRVLIWMQTFSVVFSKACWLILQVLFSNKCMERLFMLSAFQEFSNLNTEKGQRRIVLGKTSDFDKYYKALLQLPGEYPAGIWIANRKSIEFVERQTKKGEEEGKRCNELMWLLKNKSSPDFGGEKHVKPHQNSLVMRLEVERELDVCKPSFKMAVVSLLTLMAELASFIPTTDGNNLINKAIEGCFQAWNIMDIVEDSESEGVMLSKTADKLFQDLKKSRTWLGYHLPLNKDVDNSVAAAKASIRNVVDKAKEMAMEYKSRNWDEVAAGYRLYWLSLNLNYQEFTSVEEIVDKMCSALADVVASCTVKAVGVVVKDCKKWATMFEEDSILRAAHIVGKVRNLMENLEWQLKWSFSGETQSVETSVERARNGRLLRKYATFQSPGLEFDGL